MKSYDTVTRFNGGLIQHGIYNDRIYLMKTPETVSYEYIDLLIGFAGENNYSKIFAKVKINHYKKFKDKGFIKEALVPGYYGGKEPVLFMCLYLKKSRSVDEKSDKYNEILNLCSRGKNNKKTDLKTGYKLIRCSDNDLSEMAELYRRVFSTYPFPIFEEEYLKSTMDNNVDYYAVRKDSRIVSLSSAEKDMEHCNAEMTDFATDVEWRGNGLAQILLLNMEREIEKQGIKTAYTIARAASPGMNISFSRLGYNYNGRLINNTQISGRLESMNVWSKSL